MGQITELPVETETVDIQQIRDDAIAASNGASAAAGSAVLAHKWAEGTEPDGPGTKSAKEWAADSESNALASILKSLATEASQMLVSDGAGSWTVLLSTAAGRTLLTALDDAAQRSALDLGAVRTTATLESSDAFNISYSGFYILAAGTTNAPSANDCSATVAREDADNIIVTATDAVTGDVYTCSKVAGVWGAWVWVNESPVKAWVSFNGATSTIFAARNVSSITDNGVGDFTINFETVLEDANYAFSGSVDGTGQSTGTSSAFVVQRTSNTSGGKTASSLGVSVTRVSSGSNSEVDATEINVSIFR